MLGTSFIYRSRQGPVTTERLESLFRYAYRAYYRRPSYLLESLARIRSWDGLRQKGRVGLNILFSRIARQPAFFRMFRRQAAVYPNLN